MKRRGFILIILGAFLLTTGGGVKADGPCIQSFYQKSLHFTGEGMRSGYEAEDGFISLTQIPYNKLGCKNCHANSCDQCHAYTNKDGQPEYSVVRAQREDTCFTCHERGKLVEEFIKKGKEKDVHKAAGMTCCDCHKESDIHGDGVVRNSLLDSGAVRASCEGCHVGEEATAPQYMPDTQAHKKHKHGATLHCTACHVRWTMTCYNCHFTEFMKTRDKKGLFMPTNNWFMLLNHQGKVTAGTAMVLVHNGQAMVSYTPYFTHNIMKQGRQCVECHGSQTMGLIKEGKKIPLVSIEKNQINFWNGVIPVVPELLEWEFFDRKDGQWINLKTKQPVNERFYHSAEPLTSRQINLLKLRLKSRKPAKKKK